MSHVNKKPFATKFPGVALTFSAETGTELKLQHELCLETASTGIRYYFSHKRKITEIIINHTNHNQPHKCQSKTDSFQVLGKINIVNLPQENFAVPKNLKFIKTIQNLYETIKTIKNLYETIHQSFSTYK